MHVTVLGAGTMGHEIAQAGAMGGHEVAPRDSQTALVDHGLESTRADLDGGVERDKVSPAERDAALARIEGTTDLEGAMTDAGLRVETVPEDLGERFRPPSILPKEVRAGQVGKKAWEVVGVSGGEIV